MGIDFSKNRLKVYFWGVQPQVINVKNDRKYKQVCEITVGSYHFLIFWKKGICRMLKFGDYCIRSTGDSSVALPPHGPPLVPFMYCYCDSWASEDIMLMKPEDIWSSFDQPLVLFVRQEDTCVSRKVKLEYYWQHCKTMSNCVRFEGLHGCVYYGFWHCHNPADHNLTEQLLTYGFFYCLVVMDQF